MPIDAKLRVLIADDERAARQRLEDLLRREDDVLIVGSASNGRTAIKMIRELSPDLVFLDVQMPGVTGIEVVNEIGPGEMPAVIFVTAYDQYAVRAFELAAIDYMLKPFDDERLEKALDRARRDLAARDVKVLGDRLASLLRTMSPAGDDPSAKPAPPPYLERIAVEMRGHIRIVSVDRIDFITASGSYAELHVGDDVFVIREQMQSLEERLDPDVFFRIHRSTIVRLDRIDALLYSAGGDYAVRLQDGRRLKVSRSRYEELQQKLGLV